MQDLTNFAKITAILYGSFLASIIAVVIVMMIFGFEPKTLEPINWVNLTISVAAFISMAAIATGISQFFMDLNTLPTFMTFTVFVLLLRIQRLAVDTWLGWEPSLLRTIVVWGIFSATMTWIMLRHKEKFWRQFS